MRWALMKKGRQTQDSVANAPGVAQGPSQQVWDGRLLDDQVSAVVPGLNVDDRRMWHMVRVELRRTADCMLPAPAISLALMETA